MTQLMRSPNEYFRSPFKFKKAMEAQKPRSNSCTKESPKRKISPSQHVKDDSWRHDMLIALQSSANPEPIRVACMKANVKGPDHFGEIFHGTLTREEVCELLSGGNGRYLVRESISSPGDFSLSFSNGGNILHYKLFYDAAEKKYFTESDEKKYSSLTDLMLDILNMLKVINEYNNQGSNGVKEPRHRMGKRPSFTKPHNFKLHQYMHPKWCDMCHSFMWGLMRQGMKCQDCNLNVHKYCVKDVETNCGKVTVEHKIKQEPKERRRSRSGDHSRTDELLSALENHVRCDYQLDCLKCLSSKKPPASKFDLVAPMNPCYCDECCHLKDVDTPLCKIGDPPQAYSLPLGWSRFMLNFACEDICDNLTTWNIAYYSLSPETLSTVLEEGLCEKPDGMMAFPDAKAVVKLTPSIICADLDSKKVEYQDPDAYEASVVQMVLQVYVKPGSFVTMGRVGSSEEIDPYFRSTDIYWVVREENAVIPFAVLVKKMRMMGRKKL